MIVVTGATGRVGGEVARQLIARGLPARLVSRRSHPAVPDAEVVQADLMEPRTLRAAFRGASTLFLMSPGVASGLLEPDNERNAITAAREAGIARVVKLSNIGAGDPQLLFSKWHAASEKALMESGMAWTMLRPASFMSNALGWAATIQASDFFYSATGEGQLSPIDPADVAALAVIALTEDGHEGRAYTVTGPETLSASQQAAVFSTVLGRAIRCVDISLETMRESLRESGLPQHHLEARIETMTATKEGRLAAIDDVAALLGRPSTRFAEWVERNAAAFQ